MNEQQVLDAEEVAAEETVDAVPTTDAGTVEIATIDAAEMATDDTVEMTAEGEPAPGDADQTAGKVVEAPAVGDDAADGSGAVVKMLSVGQQVPGTVKRVTEFGAFVDIGVGRDGLVHISELSVSRVGKVSDVLKEGQELTLWIKKLDRDRNRISLTLIEPGRRTVRDLQKGEVVEGTVTRILPYGAFVDIGVGRDALLHVREMGEGFVAKPEDVVQVGQTIEARIIEIARRRSRIDLSLKGLRPEPEPIAAPEPEPEPEPEPQPESEDSFADIDVLSPMQLAFLKAQEKSGVVLPGKSRKANRRAQSSKKRAAQDDIISRTLSAGSKK